MPNKLSKEKAQAIAAEYCTNGFQKVVALLSVGYSTNYANNVGLKLFDNDTVKHCVAKIQAKTAKKVDYSFEIGLKKLLEANTLAIKLNQPAAAVSAILNANRMFGYDKDNSMMDEKTVEVLESHREEAERLAGLLINDRISIESEVIEHEV